MDFIVDTMKDADWLQVSDIYLAGIKTEIATFQNDVPYWEEWDRRHNKDCRFVARVEEKIFLV